MDIRQKSAVSLREDWMLLLILLAALAFVSIRAYVLPITHDEVLTALIHAKAPISDIFAHSLGTQGANNHLLNTLLIKLFSSFFGDGEIILRLPALIGSVLYLIAVYRLCRFFFQGWRKTFSLLLLVTSPFLVDFFSCARGYSLGLGFSMLALSLILPTVASSQPVKNIAGFILLMDLAALSNIIFTNVLIALTLVMLVSNIQICMAGGSKFISAVTRSVYRFTAPLTAGAIPLLIIYRPEVLGRIRTGMGDYGGKTGLWQDTVQSLVECSLYNRNYPFITTVSVMAAVALFLLAGVLLSLFAMKNHNVIAKRAMVAVAATLFIVCVVMSAQFHMFSVPYAMDRSALFLIPLYLLYLLLLLEFGSQTGNRIAKVSLTGTLGVFSGLLLMHQISCLNLTHYYLWKFDASAKDAMRRLSVIGERDGKRPRTIAVTWQLEPAMNYYRFQFNADWLPLIDRRSPDGEYDIYYLAQHDRPIVSQRALTVIEEYPVSGCILATSPNSGIATGE